MSNELNAFKILISEYDFAVNVVMTIYKTFISHDLVNKLLIAKICLAEKTSMQYLLKYMKFMQIKKWDIFIVIQAYLL